MDEHDGQAVLLVDQPVELRAVPRRDVRLEADDLLARAGELLVDRTLLGAPILEALLVLLGLGRERLLALVEIGARLLDLLLELEEPVLGRADGLLDAVDLVQGGGVLAARLHVAQLRLVLLQLLLVVGELALRLALLELGLGQPRLERRDGLDFFLVFAIDLDEVGRDRVASLLAVMHEPDSSLESVELSQKIGQRGTPSMKKGVPFVEHPSVEDGF
jgi:hypothetical protein